MVYRAWDKAWCVWVVGLNAVVVVCGRWGRLGAVGRAVARQVRYERVSEYTSSSQHTVYQIGGNGLEDLAVISAHTVANACSFGTVSDPL